MTGRYGEPAGGAVPHPLRHRAQGRPAGASAAADPHAAMLVGAAYVVPGARWIADRDRPWDAWPQVTWEQVWWRNALDKLDRELREVALQPGPVLRRGLLLNEALRDVTLLVETAARYPAGPGREWGLPAAVLVAPLPRCPAGGDELRLPGSM